MAPLELLIGTVDVQFAQPPFLGPRFLSRGRFQRAVLLPQFRMLPMIRSWSMSLRYWAKLVGLWPEPSLNQMPLFGYELCRAVWESTVPPYQWKAVPAAYEYAVALPSTSYGNWLVQLWSQTRILDEIPADANAGPM